MARGNPALNLTLRPHEAAAAAAELSSSELDICGAPAKKKVGALFRPSCIVECVVGFHEKSDTVCSTGSREVI